MRLLKQHKFEVREKSVKIRRNSTDLCEYFLESAVIEKTNIKLKYFVNTNCK